MSAVRVAVPEPSEAAALVPALGEILIDCVEGGASVSFMLPIHRRTAEAFFEDVVEKHARGRLVLFIAFLDDNAVGTVILHPVPMENQPHRAEVAKLLVRRSARKRGVASALMGSLERVAAARGRTLLCLDTASGTDAERLYEALGWQRLGVMPGYAMWPEGGFCDTTFFWKRLTQRPSG